MYPQNARDALHERLDYELWLLDFLMQTPDNGGGNPGRLIFRNRQAGAIVEMSGHIVIGGRGLRRAIDAVRPLTFVTCYKVLDMIFEWILIQNFAGGNIPSVPGTFVQKHDAVSRLRPEWFPALLHADSAIRDRLVALYGRMRDYRNEIVHRSVFRVSGEALGIGPTQKGEPELELSRDEILVFARLAVACARFLAGKADYGCHEHRLLRHQLDQIQKCHGLAKLRDAEPVLENIVLVVPGDGRSFPADLAWLRGTLAARYPGKAVLFNLDVLGTVDDEPRCAWRFPSDQVPSDALCELQAGSRSEYVISPSDIKPV
jgi:hypothetical protein